MYTEKDNRKVSVLGTEYSIVFEPAETCERLKAIGADGLIDASTKEIVVGIFEPDESSVQDLAAYQRNIMRHEIIHAFFHECGLWHCSNGVDSWATNEEMVDWIALQHNKLHAAFEQAGAL